MRLIGLKALPSDACPWRPRNASRRLGSFSLIGQRVHWITGSAAAGASFWVCAHSGRLEISSTADLVVRCGPGLKWTRRIYGLFGRTARSPPSYTRLADSAVQRLPFSPFGAATVASEQFHEPISCPERPTPIRLFLPPRIPQPAANRDIPLVASCSRARPCCCTRRGDDARRLAAEWNPVTRHRQVKSGTPFRA
jgi:hypothetical protein